jgi:Fic family protein
MVVSGALLVSLVWGVFRVPDDAVEEFAIPPQRFIDTLREQKEMKLKGGLYHLTQIKMAYNSNRIEGSRLSEDQTRYIFETKTVMGEALVNDVVEVTNHFKAFDFMISQIGTPLTIEKIKEYHRILKSGTSDAEKEWFAVGDWKQVANSVGGGPTTPPKEVDQAMGQLLRKYIGRSLTFDDLVAFHYEFEAIHPFQDGNGRVGRLILFEQCLQNGIMPFIVMDDEKAFYYRGLKEYESQPGFLRSTFRHFQDQFYSEFKDYIPTLGDAQ